MARIKQTVMQRSFQQMELRPDFLEADDLDVRLQSLKSAKNMKCLATRVTEARDGSFFVVPLPEAENVISLRPATGLEFGLAIRDNSFLILDQSGETIFTQNTVPWSEASKVWVNPMRDEILIGTEASLSKLTYVATTDSWLFSNFEFDGAPGGELAQPYWVFDKSIAIQPSAVTGSITITSNAPFWVEEFIGQRIRYGGREILITALTSSTVVQGEVINSLPPSFRVTVSNVSEYRIGEAVVGADTNYQGVIVAINGSQLDLATQSFFEGPTNGEELSSPSGSSQISGVSGISPVMSPVWDEPLMSPLRGYPRSSSNVAGRVVFLDFPNAPDVVALSSSRNSFDFTVGAEDDDAIVRRIGDNRPRWLHAVNMGDLVLLSDNGVYIIKNQDNQVVSPTSFDAILVDEVASSEIAPVKVEDGVVFVEASGQTVSGAFLDGNVYLKWSVRRLTTFHSHLIKNPKRLCGPSLGSQSAEKYMFVVNGDGSAASVSWQQNLRDETIGFAPWETDGAYVNVVPIFGAYYAIVDRTFDGETHRFWERFDSSAYLDCAVETTSLAIFGELDADGELLEVNGETLTVSQPLTRHLTGATASYYIEGWDAGDFVIANDGQIEGEPDVAGTRQIGLNYVAEVQPWPVELVESDRIGSVTVRVLQAIISVQDTLAFEAICNGFTRSIAAYEFGDDLSRPPELQTKVHRFAVYGNRDHPEIIFRKSRPGPFRVLATGQRVQG